MYRDVQDHCGSRERPAWAARLSRMNGDQFCARFPLPGRRGRMVCGLRPLASVEVHVLSCAVKPFAEKLGSNWLLPWKGSSQTMPFTG